MAVLDHWRFTTPTGASDRAAEEEAVLITHPASGLAMLVMVPDHDGRPGTVSFVDPPRDVVLVTGGTLLSMRARIGASEVRSGPHSSSRVSFIPAGTPFALEYQRDASMLVALIVPSGLLPALLGAGAALPTPFAQAEAPLLAELVYAINRQIMRLDHSDNAEIAMLTARLVAALAACAPLPQVAASARLALAPYKLRRVLCYVDSHLDQPLSLRDLAAEAGLSPYHFARAFKQAAGRSPYDHVCWRRIVRSTALVVSSDMKIAEISRSTGFNTAAHFSQVFQRAAGVPPQRFRQVVRPRLLKEHTAPRA